jgi:hypothetical protein
MATFIAKIFSFYCFLVGFLMYSGDQFLNEVAYVQIGKFHVYQNV